MASWLPYVTGPLGAMVVLTFVAYMFITGKMHSDAEFHRILTALEHEQEAHERTRHALELANARAEAGMRPAQLLAAALELSNDGTAHAQVPAP